MSQNKKYYFKYLKRNKVTSSDIRGFGKKKNYPQENIMLIH